MNIYLDVCCLCRPFDESPSNKIIIESDAVLAILKECESQWQLINSEVITHEISKIPDNEKKLQVQRFLERSSQYIELNTGTINRAKRLWEQGIDTYDALHLSCAYESQAIFLTVDKVLIRKMQQIHEDINYNITNPVKWLMEVNNDPSQDNK